MRICTNAHAHHDNDDDGSTSGSLHFKCFRMKYGVFYRHHASRDHFTNISDAFSLRSAKAKQLK